MTTTKDPCFVESERIWRLRRDMYGWRVKGRARLLAKFAKEFGVPKRMMTSVYVRTFNVERLRPDPCAFPDLDAYVAAWREELLRALCMHPADRATYAQMRDRMRGDRPFEAHKDYAIRAWRRNAERMLARHWPTRAA